MKRYLNFLIYIAIDVIAGVVWLALACWLQFDHSEIADHAFLQGAFLGWMGASIGPAWNATREKP